MTSVKLSAREEEVAVLDVLIVGGGPAGLSAALLLGRSRRRVLLCDTGQLRNAASHWVGGFFSRDGIDPRELRHIGREQLRPYTTVELRDIEVTDVVRTPMAFEATLADGAHISARKLLLATGVVDELPAIMGIEQFYGTSVHHCPYCDGWESRDQPIAVYGRGERGYRLALELTAWSHELVLCTDGPHTLAEHDRTRLARLDIGVREERIVRFEGTNGDIERIIFVAGEPLCCRALFFNMGQHQRSHLPARLGCEFTEEGAVLCSEHEATNVPGLYVAGDVSHRAQLAIIAAAEGANAAFAINTALLKEDLAVAERADREH